MNETVVQCFEDYFSSLYQKRYVVTFCVSLLVKPPKSVVSPSFLVDSQAAILFLVGSAVCPPTFSLGDYPHRRLGALFFLRESLAPPVGLHFLLSFVCAPM